MPPCIPDALKLELQERGFSRRSFGRIAALLAGGASLPFGSEHALAQMSAIGPLPADVVKINANENPLGPCPEALEVMYAAIKDGGRYRFEESSRFARTLAETEGISAEYVSPFAGSSDPLHRAVLAFTSPAKSFVTADPGFEAGFRAAQFLGAKAIALPLTKSFAHDVRAIAAADQNAGLIYICNPNNPTGTLTPRADIEWLVAHKPKGAIVLIDEAYIHFAANAPSCIDMAAADKDVLILRTFSKLYGMAGVRVGAAIARPDILRQIGRFGVEILPVAAMVGGQAALGVKDLVPKRRKINADIRDDVFDFLHKHGYSFVRSDSNKFMLDVKQPGAKIVRALAAEKVFIGRVWPSWPTHVRVSIGTRDEMEKFKSALLKVTA